MTTLRRAGGLLAALVLVTGCAFVSSSRTVPAPLVAGQPGQVCLTLASLAGADWPYVRVQIPSSGMYRYGSVGDEYCFDVTYASPGTQTIEYDVCPARWNTNPGNPGSFEIKGESCTKGSYTFTVQAPNQPVLGTGDVQVTLAWSDGADLDLHVVDPGGAETWYGNTTSASSGQLDHDTRPQCGDDNTHYENIFWPPGGAPHGQYSVYIVSSRGCGSTSDARLTIRVGGQVVVHQSLPVPSGGRSTTVTFTA